MPSEPMLELPNLVIHTFSIFLSESLLLSSLKIRWVSLLLLRLDRNCLNRKTAAETVS